MLVINQKAPDNEITTPPTTNTVSGLHPKILRLKLRRRTGASFDFEKKLSSKLFITSCNLDSSCISLTVFAIGRGVIPDALVLRFWKKTNKNKTQSIQWIFFYHSNTDEVWNVAGLSISFSFFYCYFLPIKLREFYHLTRKPSEYTLRLGTHILANMVYFLHSICRAIHQNRGLLRCLAECPVIQKYNFNANYTLCKNVLWLIFWYLIPIEWNSHINFSQYKNIWW